MQAIEVKFLPPTNNKDARLKAFCQAGSITMGIYSIQQKLIEMKISCDMYYCYRFIAEKLRDKLEWNISAYGDMIQGSLSNGNEVFVFVQGEYVKKSDW